MIVEVEQGKLEGLTRKSILTGNDYYAFVGIPYAKPPIGKLRFQIPQPIEKWDGILNAKKEGSPCVQTYFGGDYFGSEDCLYLNVYTPTPPTKDATPKAVMVFIHGGAYLAGSGSSDIYSPDYLIGYDIVLVTMNYRLHALGFLNMGTKNSADNCGLRDQWLALKWVNANIQHFGGDPKNITIFGNSAGGSSVHFHLMSPKSRGLFNKAIIQSDPIYSFLDNRYNSREMGFDLARKLGFDGNDPEKLVEFLHNQSALEIAKNIPNIFGSEMTIQEKNDLSNMLHPATDDTYDDGPLPDTLENLRKAATPVPLMIGFNNKEGRMAFEIFGENLLEILQNEFSETIKRPYDITDSKFKNICDKIKRRYLGDEPVSDKTAEKLVDMFTDFWFRKLYESIDFITNSDKPVYLYEFTFSGKFNVFEKMYKNQKNCPDSNSGAAHADELPYLFYPSQMIPNLKEISDPEKNVIKNMCSLWTNFAKTNNPTENFNDTKWRRFTSEKPCFLRIDTNLQLIEEKLRGKEFAFWNKLLP